MKPSIVFYSRSVSNKTVAKTSHVRKIKTIESTGLVLRANLIAFSPIKFAETAIFRVVDIAINTYKI